MFEKICDIIADQLDMEPEEITPQTRIMDDLGADRLDMFDMVTTMEDMFGVHIPDGSWEQIDTVQSLMNLLSEK
ncbi:MAG: acyl carrier protein [Lachnospiraceae bacterium]|nr:acyl carrier protein [Lachnospiraceae bacterium]